MGCGASNDPRIGVAEPMGQKPKNASQIRNGGFQQVELKNNNDSNKPLKKLPELEKSKN